MIWLVGCTAFSPIPKGATEVELQLHELGYVRSGETTVIETRNEYDALLADEGDTGFGSLGEAPDVDFDTHVVFTRWWVDGGCQDKPTYTGWVLDGTLSVHVDPGRDGGCEAWFPQLDVLVAPISGATAFTWAE